MFIFLVIIVTGSLVEINLVFTEMMDGAHK